MRGYQAVTSWDKGSYSANSNNEARHLNALGCPLGVLHRGRGRGPECPECVLCTGVPCSPWMVSEALLDTPLLLRLPQPHLTLTFSRNTLKLAAAEPGPPTLCSEAWQGLGSRSVSPAGRPVLPIFRLHEVHTHVILSVPENSIHRTGFIRVPFLLPQWDCLISVTNKIIKPGLHIKCLFTLAFCFIFSESEIIVSQMDSHQSLFWLAVPGLQRTETGHRDPLFPKTRVYFLILKGGFALIISESRRTHGLCSDLCFLPEHPAITTAGTQKPWGC